MNLDGSLQAVLESKSILYCMPFKMHPIFSFGCSWLNWVHWESTWVSVSNALLMNTIRENSSKKHHLTCKTMILGNDKILNLYNMYIFILIFLNEKHTSLFYTSCLMLPCKFIHSSSVAVLLWSELLLILSCKHWMQGRSTPSQDTMNTYSYTHSHLGTV